MNDITYKRHVCQEPDISTRQTTDRWGDGENGIVTNERALYNPNLTIGELSLLRHLLWDVHDKKGGWDRETTDLIHSWMFGDQELTIALDIQNAFSVGQQIDFKEK